jgi:hypothetical protein
VPSPMRRAGRHYYPECRKPHNKNAACDREETEMRDVRKCEQLDALAQGDSALTATRLARLDEQLAALSGIGPEASLALQARGSILAISEALDDHAAYFDAGEDA